MNAQTGWDWLTQYVSLSTDPILASPNASASSEATLAFMTHPCWCSSLVSRAIARRPWVVKKHLSPHYWILDRSQWGTPGMAQINTDETDDSPFWAHLWHQIGMTSGGCSRSSTGWPSARYRWGSPSPPCWWHTPDTTQMAAMRAMSCLSIVQSSTR